MNKIKKLYKDNIYGVMGTLIFHILLVSSFLLSEVRMKGEITEESVIIDLEQIREESPEVLQEKEKETEQENAPSNSDDLRQAQRTQASNRAVNDAPSSAKSRFSSGSGDPFFDEDYQKEIADAQKLVSDVNKQLSKKVKNVKEFQMPEETTDGMDPDSIKNTIYSGESNIHYYLENRYHVRLPVPVYLAQKGGKVTVDIWVSPAGNVIRAQVQSSSSSADPMLPEYALQAAQRTVFNQDRKAPSSQKGTITYTFVPQ